MAASSRGRLVVISGPSGVGKSTLLGRLFDRCPLPLVSSVSATTRPPRPGEVDGVDYYFLSKEEFAECRGRGDFLECFEVFGRGYWYGTLHSEVSPGLEAGKWVVLEIDVQGAMAVMEQFPEAISIFVRPGSLKQLEERLRGRGTETEEATRRRLEEARSELALADRYHYQIINDDLDRAVRELCTTLTRDGG